MRPRLIDAIGFDPARDRLWLTGDLVNRGPASLECLRAVRALGWVALGAIVLIITSVVIACA